MQDYITCCRYAVPRFLEELGVEYLDLLLVHSPWVPPGTSSSSPPALPGASSAGHGSREAAAGQAEGGDLEVSPALPGTGPVMEAVKS